MVILKYGLDECFEHSVLTLYHIIKTVLFLLLVVMIQRCNFGTQGTE